MTYKQEAKFPPVIWAVVANRSQAHIFSADWPAADNWQLDQTLHCEEGTLQGTEVYTDGPGTFGEVAGGHHAGEAKQDLQHITAQGFSREIVNCLEKGISENRFGKLAIIAAPLVLGELRKHLNERLNAMLVLDSDKDHAQKSVQEILQLLQKEVTKHT